MEMKNCFTARDIQNGWRKRRVVLNENYLDGMETSSDELVDEINKTNIKQFVDFFRINVYFNNILSPKNYSIRKRVNKLDYILLQCDIFTNCSVTSVTIYDMKDDGQKLDFMMKDELPVEDDYISSVTPKMRAFPDILLSFSVGYDLNKISYRQFLNALIKLIPMVSETMLFHIDDEGTIVFFEDYIINFFSYVDRDCMKLYKKLYNVSDVEDVTDDVISKHKESLKIDRIVNRQCDIITEKYDISCDYMGSIERGKQLIIRVMINNFYDDLKEVSLGDILPLLCHIFIDNMPYVTYRMYHIAFSFHIAAGLEIRDIDKADYSINPSRSKEFTSFLKTSRVHPSTFLKNGKKKKSCRFLYKSFDYKHGMCVGCYILFPRSKDDYLFPNPLTITATSPYMKFQEDFITKPV